MSDSIAERIRLIREYMAAAAKKSGRPAAAIRLMAVTKTVDDERIRQAVAAGVNIIGENYVQEAKRKIEQMGKTVAWHFIGHLQTNKAKYAVNLFDLIHSVDRIELAEEIDRRAAAAGLVMKVLIEVNVAGEQSKSGVPISRALTLIRSAAALKHLSIRGLMTMPPWCDDPEEARPYFAALKRLQEQVLAERIENCAMEELSMGMSQDYRVAIEEGATLVRIGRLIFGERSR
jgi:PLP dependent protein